MTVLSMAGKERIQPTGGRGGGDPARLVERFADRVYRFLLAMTKDSETARDLTQETFLKIHRVIAEGHDSEHGDAYVLTVARNTALSWFRRQSVEKRHLTLVPEEELETLAPPGAADNPARELDRTELRTALLEALATLSEELRAVFLLSEVEGLSYAEIADIVGCPPGTVASRKHNAVMRLR